MLKKIMLKPNHMTKNRVWCNLVAGFKSGSSSCSLNVTPKRMFIALYAIAKHAKQDIIRNIPAPFIKKIN